MSKIGGIILSISGGIISLLVGIFILVLFPEFKILGIFAVIFQIFLIIGGILTLIGDFISIRAKTEKDNNLAWKIILAGAMIGGVNILSFAGAVALKNEHFETIYEEDDDSIKIECPVCGHKNNIEYSICRYCGKALTKESST
ncbi:MAG: hypothetical protein ACFFA0_07345 [Promethearchaeota archaeon]